MQIEAIRDTLSVQVGMTFSGRDVARLEEAVAALGPFSRLDIDFGAVRECDDAALARLAGALACLGGGYVRLHGLTNRHWERLTYFGLHVNRH
jgi:hypothetical protein